ncbi:hypothetical protein WA577_005683, partial [Blastocystis sp. JDR]
MAMQRETFDWEDCCFECTKQNRIAESSAMDTWTKEWEMHLPEMLFASNAITIRKKDSSHTFHINSECILKNRCKDNEFDPLLIKLENVKTNPRIPVYSDGYHWAFPSFAGAVVDSVEEETQSALPYQQIASRDPILWSAAFILFEDELHDFGRVFCDCRVRVMRDFFYLLLQEYIQIDNQVIYVISHRYYYAFSSNRILHDFMLQKLEWTAIPRAAYSLLFEDIHQVSRFQSAFITEKHRVT